MYTSSNTLSCVFCGRDLSFATMIRYISEGPICTMCLAEVEGVATPRYVESDGCTDYVSMGRKHPKYHNKERGIA